MAAQQNQLLMIAAIGGGGYLAYKYFKDKKDAEALAAAQAAVGTPLPPNTTIIPGIGPVLAPPVAPMPTYTGAVPTPYGPVIPSNFNTGAAAQGYDAATIARMQDILYRHQYIFNSVAFALQLPSDPGLQSRIATLRAKDEVLQTEWGTYTNGARIPEGTLNTPQKKAEYINFLKAHLWCDPLVGVPC